MSASKKSSTDSHKAGVADSKEGVPALKDQKPAATLEEDDEFEDFPVEGEFHAALRTPCPCTCINTMLDWTQEDTELPSGNTHLWEESWDDDDTSEDFASQLRSTITSWTTALNIAKTLCRQELKKVDGGKKS